MKQPPFPGLEFKVPADATDTVLTLSQEADKTLLVSETSLSIPKASDQTVQLQHVNPLEITLLGEQANTASTLENLKSSLQNLHSVAEPLNLFLPVEQMPRAKSII